MIFDRAFIGASMTTLLALLVLFGSVCETLADDTPAGEADHAGGHFVMHLRQQVALAPGEIAYKPAWRTEQWDAERTAVIVCDMWDAHHCYNAVQRVKDMAGRVNEVLDRARASGVLIIHAPSDCMEAYGGHPARLRAQQAPTVANLPEAIDQWCNQIPAEEAGTYPLDQSDGGEDDDPEVHRKWQAELAQAGKNPRAPWSRQIEALEIHDGDAISDSGTEIWNLLEERDIDNVILLGVHTNMCVLGRPFGLRQMARNGKNVVLMRDLTDTMYNPARWPYVNHHTATDRIVEHIERYVCPTVLSSDLIGGRSHRFFDDRRPTVAIVVSEFEYETYRTLPQFAHDYLGKDFRVTYAINNVPSSHDLPGIEILDDADLAIMSVWRRTLPSDQLRHVREFVAAGKPLVAIRTTSHAFATRDGKMPAGRETWPQFDRQVLGGNYHGHHGNHTAQGDLPTQVWVAPQAQGHPLLMSFPSGEIAVTSWLYKVAPLAEGATPLLMGRVGDQTPHEPVAWVNTSAGGGRVFYTSLGHQGDFRQQAFVRLLANAVYWAAGLPVPPEIQATAAQAKPAVYE